MPVTQARTTAQPLRCCPQPGERVRRSDTREQDWAPPAHDPRSPHAGVAEESVIIGSDGRALPASTSTHPFDSIVRLELFRNGTPAAWCSGAYIGPWTVITSAHCLLQQAGAVTQINFQAGRQGTSFPFGNIVCRNDDAPSSNNITYYSPGGFNASDPASDASGPFDYAVIDTYPCHGTTRFFNGYLVNPNDATYSMHGYPQGQCPGTSGNAGNWGSPDGTVGHDCHASRGHRPPSLSIASPMRG